MYDLVRTSGVQPKILSKQQLTNTIRTIEKRLRCTSGVLLLLSMTLQVLLLVDSIVAQLPCIFYDFSYSVTWLSGALFRSTGCTRVALHLVHFQQLN